MNAFDVLVWAAAILVLIRVLGTRDARGWIPFGIIAGIALENKISPLFLGFGVAVGLVVTRDWEQLKSRRLVDRRRDRDGAVPAPPRLAGRARLADADVHARTRRATKNLPLSRSSSSRSRR